MTLLTYEQQRIRMVSTVKVNWFAVRHEKLHTYTVKHFGTRERRVHQFFCYMSPHIGRSHGQLGQNCPSFFLETVQVVFVRTALAQNSHNDVGWGHHIELERPSIRKRSWRHVGSTGAVQCNVVDHTPARIKTTFSSRRGDCTKCRNLTQ